MADATDTAASILAPPDPTWNPPPTAVPDAVANPQQPTQTPLQGTPESVDVNSSDPTSVQPQSSPALTSTIPSETPPNNPDVERHYHEGKLHHVLGRIAGDVASTLTGPETWHITRDPKTGDVSAVQQPSTLGEKWGRIAATALGGLAAGLQNAQGPGGFARAAGAGIQSGLQQPQQQQQQAQQQVDFDNKQLQAKANRIHLTQQTAMEAAQTRLTNLRLDQETADVMNKNLNDYQGRPGSIDYGPYDPSDPKGEMNLAKKYPGAMDDFLGKNNRKTAVVLEPDHKLHVIGYNGSDADRWNDKPTEVPYNDMDKNGKPIISTKTAGPGTHRQGELDLTRDAVQAEYLKRMGTWAKAQDDLAKSKTPPKPVTPTEASFAYDATHNPDPAERARSRQSLNLMKEKPGTGTEETSGFDPQSSLQQNAEMMVDGLASPSLMSKRAKDYNQMLPLAQAYSQQKYGQPFDAELSEGRYQARKEVLQQFAGGKPADQIQSFQTFTNHAQNLMDDVADLRTTNIKLVNMAYNKVRNLSGSPAITSLQTHVEALRREYLNFLSNNMALKGDEITEGKEIMSDASTPAQIEQGVKAFTETAIGRVSALNNRALRFNVPIGGEILTPQNRQTIANMGLGDYANQMIRPQPQAPHMFGGGGQQQAQPAQPTPPQGGGGQGTSAPPTDGKGQTWNAQTYRDTHPGQDSKQMIQWAKAHNFKVINE